MSIDTAGLINYYANLLIKQFRSKSKAYATIQMVVDPVIMPIGGNLIFDNDGNVVTENNTNINLVDKPGQDNTLPNAVLNAFNINDAIGDQLDTIGKYVGVTRDGYSFSGAVHLGDDDYRTFLQMVMVRNQLHANLFSIQKFMDQFLSGEVQLFDQKTMRMDLFYLLNKGDDILAEMFIMAGFFPRPLAVRLNVFLSGFSFFGYRSYAEEAPSYVFPYNSYSSYISNRPYLSYNDAIIL